MAENEVNNLTEESSKADLTDIEFAFRSYLKQVQYDPGKTVEIARAYRDADSFKDFTKYCREELGLGCPKYWERCADGSCAPPGGCSS
jgi:hypothetical protein